MSYTASSDPTGLRDRSALAQGIEHDLKKLRHVHRNPNYRQRHDERDDAHFDSDPKDISDELLAF